MTQGAAPIVRTEDIQHQIVTHKIAQSDAATLIATYSPMFQRAQQLVEQSSGIVVTSETQTAAIKKAREARLALREVRIEAEHARKTLKEDSLRKGKAIDGIANVLKLMIEPEEARLLGCEMFVERQIEARKAELRESRGAELAMLGINPAQYKLDEMTQAEYEQLRDGIKLQITKQREAEKAERERQERLAEQDRAERERLKAENAKLAAEKAKAEQDAAAARREQAAAQEKLREQEAEARRAAAAQERRQRAAALAPVATKLDHMVGQLKSITEANRPHASNEYMTAALVHVNNAASLIETLANKARTGA